MAYISTTPGPPTGSSLGNVVSGNNQSGVLVCSKNGDGGNNLVFGNFMGADFHRYAGNLPNHLKRGSLLSFGNGVDSVRIFGTQGNVAASGGPSGRRTH